MSEPSPLATSVSPRSPTGGRLPGRASSRGKRDGRPSSQASLDPAPAPPPLSLSLDEQSAAAAAASNPNAGSSNITGGLHLPNFNAAEVEEDPEEDPILKQKAHQDDDIVFDTARPYMPPAPRGNWFLLASIGVQSLMLVFLFLGFHHKDSSFNCCNAYAVTVVVLFEVIQFAAYYLDWRSIEGFNPMWHRSNLFSPAILFAIIFVLWGIGTFAMMAHVIDVDLFATFTKGFTKITPLQQASFVIATVVGIADVCLFMIVSYAHRNNLGHFYYMNHETPVELTQLIDYTIPVSGSFGLSHHFQDLATKLQVETSRKASKNLPLLIMVSAALQIPFYVFCAASYSGGNQSSLPIISLCVGSICVASQASYIMGAATNRARKTRKWNRTNMFFPIIAAYAIIGTYFFTMTSVFFTNEQNAEIWENILDQLDPFERACFTICLICVCVIFLLHILLTNLHRKGWCEGSKEIEIMLKATANLDGRKNMATSKPAARFQAALLAADRASGINAKTAPLAFGKSKIKTKAGKKAPALFADMSFAAALGSGGALKIGGDQSDTESDISVKKPSALRSGDRLRPGMDLSVTREADEYSTSRR